MIYQYKVELQERIKKSREKITNCLRKNVRENNKNFTENNMRRKNVKIKKIVININ